MSHSIAIGRRIGLQTGSSPTRRSRIRFTALGSVSDAVSRLVIAGLFLALSSRIAHNFLETGHVTGLLLLASELLVVALTVIRRPALVVDRRWWVRAITAASILGPLVVRPGLAPGLVPDWVSATLSGAGLLVAVGGKLSLGRSFGVVPANRGIVCSGLYRYLRHPIYAGYIVTDIGFLLAHASPWNAVFLLGADAGLLVRSREEERVLARDGQYAGYLGRVKWRVIPGVF